MSSGRGGARPVQHDDETAPRGAWLADCRAGFFVFLIALPLCLGIALASGFPALAGVFTAIVGGVAGFTISNSALAIKGPAAGLIVIVAGCVADFGGDGAIGGFSAADLDAYRAALAIGFAAAGLQVVFALSRGGVLAEFFPSWVVHGMLAAIGVIIVLKQLPIALGVEVAGEPLEILLEVPAIISHTNPAIGLIGVVSIGLMLGWPIAARRVRALDAVPAPAVVLLFAVPVSVLMGIGDEGRAYTLGGHEYALDESFLIVVPERVFGMFEAVTTPDFSALSVPVAWKWVAMFFLIGSLESLLSAKAIERLDPLGRRTDLDRDMLAVGVGNAAASMVGGLPMISEIVRSRANVDEGARTRAANLWHGVFLLACVAMIPMVLHLIPLAALAAMLVVVGLRLAHPREALHAWRVGREQFIAFGATIIGVLLTDLLIGVAIGIAAKIVTHLAHGVSIPAMLRCPVEIGDDGTARVRGAAVFTNWIPLRRRIAALSREADGSLVVDFSGASFVDHTTIEKLEAFAARREADGPSVRIEGWEALRPLAEHPLAARIRDRGA